MKGLNRISKVVSPWQISFTDKASVSLSQKLLKITGLMQFNDGLGILSPLLVKSLGKLKEIVRKEMKQVSALEFSLPVFTRTEFLKTSGRFDLPDLFKVKVNENKSYILSPTCEEAACHFIKSFTLTYKHLPIRLYQISLKFRNEKRPRSGLLRAREFLMKDLYCFDSDNDTCEQCYQEIVNQYHHIFNLLEVPYICATGSTGNIGGLKSHEFHFLADAGQDKIILCQDCGHNVNVEVNMEGKNTDKCPECKSNNIIIRNGIEVGHAFKLGTIFTKLFEVTYLNKNSVNEIVHMSSFGLGLTRILAASLEVLSKPDAIVWPIAIAPYLVCIIPPKAGSKEEKIVKNESELIYHNLNRVLEDDVIMDDRTSMTIGKRIRANNTLGFPIQIAIGKSMFNDPPTVEVIETATGSSDFVQIPDINQYILNKLSII